MATRLALAATVMCGIAVVTTGCGESGSSPVLFAEVRFEVTPAQGAQAPFQFEVQQLVAGGVVHDELAGTTLQATGPFSIILENAVPPYSGTFRQAGDTAIRVHLVQEGTNVETSSETSGKDTTVTPSILGQQPPPPPNLGAKVRFDLCAQIDALTPCSITETTGAPGQQFTGSVGDPFTTYLVGQSIVSNPQAATPAIVFFEGARDTVNAVFTGVNAAHLRVEMFINGTPRGTQSGTGDLVFRQDL